MNDFVMPLMLALDTPSLTMSLINIASPRSAESALADSVEAALRGLAHLDVSRDGDTVIARTDLGHDARILVAGHLTTASSVEDPLAYVEMGKLYGPGASDAKGALAVMLKAAAVGSSGRDVTFVFYSGELPDVVDVDFALLAEPTNSAVVGTLDHPLAQQLIGLTDVPAVDAGDGVDAHGLAHFAAVGVPAVAFGPGDPTLAGSPDEFVPTAQLTQCEFVLRQFLTA